MDGTESQHGQEGDRELGRVPEIDRDAITAAHAVLGQPGGDATVHVVELGIGVAGVVHGQREQVRTFLGPVVFIDAHRHDVVEGKELGVEPICSVLSNAGLQVAASTYYAAKTRRPSARARRDAELSPALRKLWEDNYCVYGARKLWKAARRAGYDVGRDQVARLMRAEGIEGVRRTKQVRTTRPAESTPRHPDLVNRDFTATGPNQLWVTDLTFVPTWAGIAYVCFIVDAFSRMIVGWRG